MLSQRKSTVPFSRLSTSVQGLQIVSIAAILTALMLVVDPYWKNVIVVLEINILLVLSFRLITLMGGWTFAHVATMGIGGYAVAILSQEPFNLPVLVTVLVGSMAAALFALAISYPVLRTRQYHFFLATFAAGEALRQAFIQFREVTSGLSGIAFISRPAGFEDPVSFQFLLLIFLVATTAALLWFERSRIGIVVKAVGANEELSASLGANAWAYRALVFVAGSFIAGLAGGLFASYNGIVSPADFSSTLMFKIVVSTVLGGATSYIGPVVGLIFLTATEQIFRSVPQLVPLLWGAAVIIALLAFRGRFDKLVSRVRSRVVAC